MDSKKAVQFRQGQVRLRDASRRLVKLAVNMKSPRLVLGIGSGRCGTQSLARLLDQQPAASVTHEITPVLSWKDPQAKGRIAERLTALRFNGRNHEISGDIAHYYLNYVNAALELDPKLRVICLKRPREEVIESYYRWVTERFGPGVNHWKRPGSKWKSSAIWSKCFPKYATDDMREAIGLYWDEYYQSVDALLINHPDRLRMFDMRTSLNTEQGQRELLSFLGVSVNDQKLALGAIHHANTEPKH